MEAVAADSSPVPGQSAKTPGGKPVIVALDGSGDYRSIQDAIDRALPGATILIRSGQYQEDVTVHSKDGLRLVGEGAKAVTVAGRNRVGAFHVGKWPYGATNVEISGLTIKEHGGLALGIFNGHGVMLKDLKIDGLLFGQQVQNVRIERCEIAGSETTGAQFADSEVTLVSNFIHDTWNGTSLRGICSKGFWSLIKPTPCWSAIPLSKMAAVSRFLAVRVGKHPATSLD
jgi:pectin methylesterase-like acyl-CoA thioesterase